MSIEMKRVFAALVPCEGPDYMINEMPLCMRILKPQLGTGPEKGADSPVILGIFFFLFNAISLLIYNGEYLSIRPETVTIAKAGLMEWNNFKWARA